MRAPRNVAKDSEMFGKDTTKTQYSRGGSCGCYAKGGSVKGAAKIAKVMGEFKRGELHSGSKKGPEVKSPKQAVAIAISEARNAKPVKKARGGPIYRTPTIDELNQADRDVGGMSEREVRAAGEAIGRGNRIAIEEGNESRLVKRKATPNTREVAVQNSRAYSRAEPAEPMEPQTELSRRLSTVPSQRGEMRRGPAGAGFSARPLVETIRGALGLKNGGLAVMPRAKR